MRCKGKIPDQSASKRQSPLAFQTRLLPLKAAEGKGDKQCNACSLGSGVRSSTESLMISKLPVLTVIRKSTIAQKITQHIGKMPKRCCGECQ
jgi:hypothetical protein